MKMYKITQNIFVNFFIAIIVLNPFYSTFSQQKKFKVVIDAGHGGRDSGAISAGKKKIKEKDIVLSVAKLVYKKLKKYSDVQPILTRSKDVFLELHQRAKITNKQKADVFISIHCNANKNKKANGAETFVLGIHRNKDNLEVVKRENSVIKLEENNHLHYEGFDPSHPESFIGLTLLQEEYLEQSILLASLMQNEYKKNIKKLRDRSVQQAGFAVLRLTSMPSVLTEIGFLTNPEEEKILNSSEGQEKIANSIVNAIITYKNYIKYNTPLTDLSAQKPVEKKNNTSKASVLSREKTFNDNTYKQRAKDVIFKVQILASSKLIALKPENFKGLQDLSMMEENGLYKYFAGNTSDFDKIREIKAEARYKLFKNAFIVAFKNGKKIPLSEILGK